MATEDKRQSVPPTRLQYSGLGQQSEEQRVVFQIKEEPIASTSEAIPAPPPAAAANDKKSSHSSSSSRFRQVDLKLKRELQNLTNEYEEKKFSLEDQLVDLKRRLQMTTDNDEVIRISHELSDVEVEIPRLERDLRRKMRNLREQADLDKEEIQIDIDEEQYYDPANDGEPVRKDVENWINTQVVTAEDQLAPPAEDIIPQAPPAEKQYPKIQQSISQPSPPSHIQRAPPSHEKTTRKEMPRFQESPVFQQGNRSVMPPPPPIEQLYGHQYYQSIPPPPQYRNLPQPQRHQYNNYRSAGQENGNVAMDLARAMKDAFQELKGEREWEPRELPNFNGRAEDWPIFINEFRRTTPEGKVNSSQNAIRLRKALRGVAKDAVAGLLNEPNNVTRILSLLEDRFGRSELVIATLIKKAEDCRNVDPFKPETFVEFSTIVIHLVESVKSLKEDSFLNDRTLLNKLVMKLPLTFSSEWLDYLESHSFAPKNLDTFGKWAERKMKKLVHLVNPVIREEREQKFRLARGSAYVHVAATENMKEDRLACPCCDRTNHSLKNCFKFKKMSVKERSDLVRKSGHCFQCLDHGHIKAECKSEKKCGKDKCESAHHYLLHHDDKTWRKASNYDRNGTSNDDEQKDRDSGLLNIGAINTTSSKPLSIVQVKIRGDKGIRKVFALLDSGADTTVIEAALAKEVGIQGRKTTTTCKGVGGIKQSISGEEVDFEIAGGYRKARYYQIKSAVTHPDLQLSPYSQDVKAVKAKWPYLHKAKLESFVKVVPRIIIGEDHPYVTAHRQLLQRGEDDPMAKRTLLGWVLGGRGVNSTGGTANINTLTFDDREYLDNLLKSHFSLASYGVYPQQAPEGSLEDRRALEMLKNTTKKKGKFWECGLLWKDPTIKMPDSRSDALTRMLANERRMRKDPIFSEMYHSKMEEYLRKGYIHELTPAEVKQTTDKTLYIPHFGVFNVNKPGKLRLVFDAANRTGNVSLNQHLLTGPDLIRPLPSVLMNFRKHNVVINGDIEDMFHRVSMKKEDRESQRFLFRDIRSEGNPIKTYTMDVLIFGACSSPASAIYVKNRNAEVFAETYPDTYKAIQDDFYIDDCLTGAATVEEAIDLCKQIREIHAAGNFAVKKWLSNAREVILSIPEEDRAAGLKGFGDKSEIPTERVLGLWYSAEEDVFTFSANYKKIDPSLLEGRRPSKREMCRVIMSVFDPLGFLANYKIKGLILLQQTWRSGVDWDEDISDSTYEQWKIWIHNLKETENVKIPRIYCYDIDTCESVQLHTLVDASEEACSAICYIRVKQGEIITVSFVIAKTNVAPTKKLTMPRLELTSAVVGVCLADKVQNELNIKISGRFFWCDSKTVLMWIRTETLRYKEFVANRINRIHLLSSVSEWRWIPTALNVADQGTRLNSKIVFSPESIWLTGPPFLKDEPDDWPQERKCEDEKTDEVAIEEKKVNVFSTSLSSQSKDKTDVCVRMEGFSDFNRMIRAQAAFLIAARYWICKVRKVNYFDVPWKLVGDARVGKRKRKYVGIPNIPMLKKAEDMIIRQVQDESFGEDIQNIHSSGRLAKGSKLVGFSPFMKNGILRVKGRIANADIPEDAKYPIILPAKHHFTELLIMKEHQRNGHQGHATVLSNLRQRYWILEGRTAVSRVVEKCQLCHLKTAKPVIPKMGELPYYRLSIGQPAFTYTGVDLFGPLEVVVGRHHEKRWVSIFTCMVTRAIHLEVVYGLTTDETMMAISRFVDQRGRPRHIYSDNGTNFVGAKKELHNNWEAFDWSRIQNLDKFREINWHFSPPCSPHFGGAWERMVQAVKKVLKKTMFEVYPKDQTLLTMLKGAESLINSRPLTYLSNDPSDPEPLTPNHFLRGFTDIGPNVPGEYEPADEVLRSQWRRSQYFFDLFWKRWTKEVLPELSRRDKWYADAEPLGVGDIVLMVDDQCPRNVWRKGVVVGAFPGKDGQVRVVSVEVSDFETRKKSMFRRGVDKVVPLGLKMEKSGRFA